MANNDNITCIPLWDCLLIPLRGDVGDTAAQQLVADVLERVHRHRCFGVLIDVSGIWTLDGHLCRVLTQLALAVRMMGARAVLAGMRPEIAATLQGMGIELRGLEVAATVEQALGSMGITRIRSRYESTALRT